MQIRLALDGAHEGDGDARGQDASKRRAGVLNDLMPHNGLSLGLGPVSKKPRTGIVVGGGGVGGVDNATGGAGKGGAGVAARTSAVAGAGQGHGVVGVKQAWDGSGGQWRGCFALDKLQDYKISWKLHLFPGGFSIEGQNEAHPYDKTVKEFLTSLDLGLLPADVTMDTPTNSSSSFDYYDGCLVAEVRDHRLCNAIDLKPRVYRVLLQPDNLTVTNDLCHVW